MNENWLFFVEFLIFSGVALGWGFWQLWTLRRDRRKSSSSDGPPPSEAPPRHPDRQH